MYQPASVGLDNPGKRPYTDRPARARRRPRGKLKLLLQGDPERLTRRDLQLLAGLRTSGAARSSSGREDGLVYASTPEWRARLEAEVGVPHNGRDQGQTCWRCSTSSSDLPADRGARDRGRRRDEYGRRRTAFRLVPVDGTSTRSGSPQPPASASATSARARAKCRARPRRRGTSSGTRSCRRWPTERRPSRTTSSARTPSTAT